MKERLHDTLEEERDSSRLLVLCGLGGAGKSSLALNYLLSYRKDYTAVFWLHAASEGSLRKECEKIHGLLQGTVRSRSTKDIDGVKQWF
jgi:GTPase SAR1 family protein